MNVFPNFITWLKTLKSKIINNFKIFRTMCHEGCKYNEIIYNIYFHIDKISKIN